MCTLSTVLPHATECDPHALLPIIPPSVQRLCVDGSGPNVRPCGRAASRSASSTTPGCTRAVRASGSIATIAFIREKSSTTAVLTAWPAIDVRAPTGSSGTSCSRQTAIAAATSSASRGVTTPIGTRR